LLINNQGQLKLADFGLSRTLRHADTGADTVVEAAAGTGRPPQAYTNRVITIGYRPPELLLGATLYGAAVDMWSAGCILPELFLRRPLFRGAEEEVAQLALVFQLCGSPDAETWPDADALPWTALMRPRTPLPRILAAELAKCAHALAGQPPLSPV
jgi:CTD kinase subunit alpha